MLQVGARAINVTLHFGCSRQPIHNLGKLLGYIGSVHDRPRSGVLCVTSLRDDHIIRLNHLRNRILPATDTAQQLHVSAQIIRNRLRQFHIPIPARRPYTGRILRICHRVARLAWTQRHLRRAQTSGFGLLSATNPALE
jgi:hypothetical protein